MNEIHAIKASRFQLFIILITAGMDIFHLGIVYPIFAKLSSSNGFLYALLIGAFPFAQCIAAPLLGRLSDAYGRGRLLKLTVAGSAIGMLLCAWGVTVDHVGVLITGRLLGGLMGGNLSIAYAAIADLSTKNNKIRNLSLIPLTVSIGFALGPLLVSQMAASALWIAVLLSLVNWALLWFFDEPPKASVHSTKDSVFLLKNSKLWAPVLILFSMISANLLLVQYIGPYGIHRLHLDLEQVSWLYVNLSVAVAIGHLMLTRKIPFPAHQTLPWALVALALSLFAVSLTTTLTLLHLTLALAMFCCAVAYTNAFAYLSNHAEANNQGHIMGIGVSVQCLAEWIPAIAIGGLTLHYPSAPMICGAAACIIATFILWRRK